MKAQTTLMKAFEFRYACRNFDPARAIATSDMDFILEAGRLSPSSIGIEPWRFVVVRNQGIKQLLCAACGGQQQMVSGSEVIVIVARTAELAPDSDFVKKMLRRFGLPDEQYRGLLAF